MLMGLGLIFYGMGVMGTAMAPLRTFPPFLELMQASPPWSESLRRALTRWA